MRQKKIPTVDAFAEFVSRRGIFLEFEIPAGGKMGDQLAALLRVVEIEHRQLDVLHLQRGGITENHHLDDGRANQQQAGVRVAQRLDKLLPQHMADARE